MSALRLADDQLDELVERVAIRLSQILEDRQQAAVPELVGPAELARLLGVSRSTVYEHKTELGGRPIGDGPRPRWRFDVDQALHRWRSACGAGERSESPEMSNLQGDSPLLTSRRRVAAQTDDRLLPIKGTGG